MHVGMRNRNGGRFCVTGYQLGAITQGGEGFGAKLSAELPPRNPPAYPGWSLCVLNRPLRSNTCEDTRICCWKFCFNLTLNLLAQRRSFLMREFKLLSYNQAVYCFQLEQNTLSSKFKRPSLSFPFKKKKKRVCHIFSSFVGFCLPELSRNESKIYCVMYFKI